MRLAYVCADFGIPIRGYKGASVHVRELVAALAAQGHDVRVFSPNAGSGNDVAAPLHPIAVGRSAATSSRLIGTVTRRIHPRLDKEIEELSYNLTLYRGLRACLRSWRPDAIYERYSLFNAAGLALARRMGLPHLLEVNAPLRLERARTKGLALAPAAGLVERTLFGRSDAILVVSDALRRYVLEHGGETARTVVLPNAVDTRRFVPHGPGAEVRDRLGLPHDAFVIGFAGSLKTWHGVEVLLDAFAVLRTQEPTTRLLVVGEGPQEESARARAAALGLGPAVVFTGRVAHDAMPGLLSAMDAGVAPYVQVPDFYFSPLKLYEYMAAGLAVVASDAGEIAALIRDGQTGLLCPPGDAAALSTALLRLARDPAIRARLAATARVEAERHTWMENARTVSDLAVALRAHSAGRWRHGDAAVGRAS